MSDRSNTYSDLERREAMLAAKKALPQLGANGAAALVEAVFGAIGMRRAVVTFRSMGDAPRDRDIELRTPKGAVKRATWWAGWEHPQDAHPWAWREARPDGTVGEPIPEADGWRELTT